MEFCILTVFSPPPPPKNRVFGGRVGRGFGEFETPREGFILHKFFWSIKIPERDFCKVASDEGSVRFGVKKTAVLGAGGGEYCRKFLLILHRKFFRNIRKTFEKNFLFCWATFGNIFCCANKYQQFFLNGFFFIIMLIKKLLLRPKATTQFSHLLFFCWRNKNVAKMLLNNKGKFFV